MRVQPTTKELIEMLYERLPEIFHRPQRTWQGLTDEERSQLVTLHHGWNEYAQAIESKLKEKNT